MAKIEVDASDLLRWARYIEDIPKFTKPALAKALNTFGGGMVNETIRMLADKYGWDEDAIRQRLIVQEADSHHLEFSMDASLIVQPGQDWSRPWESRDQSDFEQDTLMNIVVFDEDCCDICREAAGEGPYTMSQITEMQAKWAGYEPPTPNILAGPITNLLHPRCRCSAQPWSSYRRLPVSFASTSTSGGGGMPSRLMTMKGLAQAVKDEVSTELRIKRTGY